MESSIRFRRARETDISRIVFLIQDCAEQGLLLPRDVRSVRAHEAEFTVGEVAGDVVACAALTPLSPDLIEIRSLVVRVDHRGRGIGHRLVRRLLCEAAEKGYPEVLAITKEAKGFFESLGFTITSFARFPDEVLAECDACPRYREGPKSALVRAPWPIDSILEARRSHGQTRRGHAIESRESGIERFRKTDRGGLSRESKSGGLADATPRVLKGR